MAHSQHHRIGTTTRSFPANTLNSNCYPYHTQHPPLPWLSAYSRPDRTAKRRFEEAKIGAAAGTTQHASCTTNLIITHQTTSQLLPSEHTNTTPITLYMSMCGDTIMTARTDNSLSIYLNKHTSCYTHQRALPSGATTSSSSVPQPAFGGTTDSVTLWYPCRG